MAPMIKIKRSDEDGEDKDPELRPTEIDICLDKVDGLIVVLFLLSEVEERLDILHKSPFDIRRCRIRSWSRGRSSTEITVHK